MAPSSGAPRDLADRVIRQALAAPCQSPRVLASSRARAEQAQVAGVLAIICSIAYYVVIFCGMAVIPMKSSSAVNSKSRRIPRSKFGKMAKSAVSVRPMRGMWHDVSQQIRQELESGRCGATNARNLAGFLALNSANLPNEKWVGHACEQSARRAALKSFAGPTGECLNPCPGSLSRRRPARGKSACFVDRSSPCRQPPPPPSHPLCKLALIDYADHCIPMSYVVFRVCKRARQLCKLASSPSPVAPCATDLCYLVLPKLRNGAAKAPRTPRQGRTKNGVLRPPAHNSCKLGLMLDDPPSQIRT